ncbi:unnamed protein product [Auanema sp. JU1783]|nr:unnamed protein product [Auanema sp. JU1783]
MKFLLLAVGLVSLALAEEFVTIGYKNCKSNFDLKDVAVSGCSLTTTSKGKKLCEFKKKSTPRMKITFVANQDASALETAVKAKVDETMMDFPLPNRNTCDFGLQCPLKAGKEYTYEQAIQILENYPVNEVFQVSWTIGNAEHGNDVCLLFLVRVVE